MKQLLIIITIILIPFTILATVAEKKVTDLETGSLTINVTGFETSDGEARIALINSKTDYDEGNNYREKKVPVKEKKVQCTIENLEFGEYGVKVFHDENSNGELDTAMFGIPKEAYGFSNNARSTFGPPKYSKVVFKFESSDQEIFIKIK